MVETVPRLAGVVGELSTRRLIDEGKDGVSGDNCFGGSGPGMHKGRGAGMEARLLNEPETDRTPDEASECDVDAEEVDATVCSEARRDGGS